VPSVDDLRIAVVRKSPAGSSAGRGPGLVVAPSNTHFAPDSTNMPSPLPPATARNGRLEPQKPRGRDRGLTPKQRRFVEEYLIDLNATQAAIRAGYSQQTARAIASENLTKPDIQAAIGRAMSERSDWAQLTAKQVLNELALIAFSDIRDIDFGPEGQLVERTPGASRAVASYAWSHRQGRTTHRTRRAVRLWNKVAALKLLMEHFGLLDGPPTLDALLSYFPADFGEKVRACIARMPSAGAPVGTGSGSPPASRLTP
jgi:phage terminase small subunit